MMLEKLVSWPYYWLSLQHNRGRLVKPRWVVGILDKRFQPPRPVFKVVKNRSAQTLTPVIQKYVATGSTVTTDLWKGYHLIKNFYRHETVNHSRYYVDPVTGNYMCIQPLACLSSKFTKPINQYYIVLYTPKVEYCYSSPHPTHFYESSWSVNITIIGCPILIMVEQIE